MYGEVRDLPLAPAMRDTPHWGPLTVERHRALCDRGIYLHVYVAGEDVTDRCRFVDDTPGRAHAVLYRLTRGGRYIVRDARGDRPALVTLRGAVSVREGARFGGAP